MSAGECNDRIRFSLSDDSGVLCFEAFAIADSHEWIEIWSRNSGLT